MPSRQFAQRPDLQRHQFRHLVPLLAGGLTAAFSLLVLLSICLRKFTKKRTAPSSDFDCKKPPHKLSYSLLRHATSNFCPSLRLGQGGFGSVYRGVIKLDAISKNLPSHVAIKLLDSGSLQGESEFQNELFFSSKIDSKHVVSVTGFSSNPRKRRMLLVYELMENGSLQDILFHRKCEELKNWDKRFLIALDIAKGLEYLHHCCDPPIIHGDVKPSNILLDGSFNAKIADFGLARLKLEENVEVEVKEGNLGNGVEGNGSVVKETESAITASGFEEFNNADHRVGVEMPQDGTFLGVEASPEVIMRVELSPEAEPAPVFSPSTTVAAMALPSEGLEKTSESDGNFDKVSIESGGERNMWKKKKKKKNFSGNDWWWKQDNRGERESGGVKDYVMEWIRNEIKKDRGKSDWVGASSSAGVVGKLERKKKEKQLDWWLSLDDNKNLKTNKKRPAREWWKEEYCVELEKKNKKKKKKYLQGSISDDFYGENWVPRDGQLYADRKKKCRNWSRGSMDWRFNGFSGELWRVRGNSYDSISGEIPKSGGFSSTPSMRGTVCYVAPEYGGGVDISEKCDVYSYGVSLLVLIAGRRPLQVAGSPISEFQRANLLSWARHLACTGNLLDLVDQNIQSLNREQALLCITVALLCLQKSPACRPSMKEVVGMLCGDLESPRLPVEFSLSPPSRFPFKSRKKFRRVLV